MNQQIGTGNVVFGSPPQSGLGGNLQMATMPRCECHECTQARYKMSMEYKFAQAINQSQNQAKKEE